MRSKFAVKFVILGIVLCSVGIASTGLSQEPFYKGKTLRIVVAFSAGGGFDTYSRLIARHMGKHIPGNPTIIVENMTGAGGVIAAKHIYNSAKPDGLTIGNIHSNTVFGQVLGRKGIDLDSRRFEYIGVPVRDTSVCTLTRASGVTTMQQWLRSKQPIKIGGTAPGDAISDTARILKDVLKLPVHLIEGYKGGADIRLASEANEVSGMCWSWEAAKATWSKAIQAGDVNVIVQLVNEPHPELSKAPLAIGFAKTEEERQLIRAGIHDTQIIRRLYVLPPQTPVDRAQLLRRAFMNTMKDSEFLAEAQKSKLDIDPVTGEETDAIVKRLFNLDGAVVSRLKEILG